jgi:hypothetical protein
MRLRISLFSWLFVLMCISQMTGQNKTVAERLGYPADSKLRGKNERVIKKRSGPRSVSFSREETSPARYLKTRYCCRVQPLNSGSAAARESCNQGDDEYHQENEEQELRNSSRRHCDSAKTKNRSDDRHNQKYQRPIKHAASSSLPLWQA